METKQFVKDYIKQIEEIAEHMQAIKKVVASLPESASWAKSLNTSATNFDKKLTSFLAQKANKDLTEQQKKAIAAIKAGKPTEEILSALSSATSTSGNEPEHEPSGQDESGSGSNDEKAPKKASIKRTGKGNH